MNADRKRSSAVRGDLRHDEPLRRHTSWHVGGPADRFYVAADADDLAEFLASLPDTEPVTWLGLGSNMLVRDGGIRGTVIAVARMPVEMHRVDGRTIRVSASAPCARAARFAAGAGLAGAEFLAGIPGTVGGALAMNAGAFGGETWTLVSRVQTLARNGDRHWRPRTDFHTGYRSVKGPAGEWFLAAEMRLHAESSDGAAAERIRELLAQRAQSQPTGRPSCGSVFRNPPGDHAGRLIEQCGLKGLRHGGAAVSDKHANFIINEGAANAADIEALILEVRNKVRADTGVDLEPEVQIVGEHAPAPSHGDVS